ncbi:DAOA isoform 9 [Pan troglodytes]|uniref:DAOA isoform 9 n=1 Tax=Pan troglodytes TaxID=9598 RepID=A0A2J8M9G9_PANTR|nr:DAOA isoform 9 [Pan troglodytes]
MRTAIWKWHRGIDRDHCVLGSLTFLSPAQMASKDRRQPLERMWTCNYNQQKDQSCNHKEITSTKAE